MPLAKKKSEEKFTYKDYTTWPDGERWEVIDGVPYNMSPAPSFDHQRITGMFYHVLMNKLMGKKPCTPVISPTDVVLSEYDVVQPDVFVVCDKKKITKQNIKGAPDLVIEVLSPSTAPKDKREKKLLYQNHGVREYIIIDPLEKYVERFYLNKDGQYSGGDVFAPDETIKLLSLSEVKVELSEIFEEIEHL